MLGSSWSSGDTNSHLGERLVPADVAFVIVSETKHAAIALNLKMCLPGVGAEHTAQLNQCQGKNAGERHSHLVWAFALKRGVWKHSE